MMERSGVLTDVTAYNSVLEGYSRTGDLGAVFMFYHDMSEAEVPADLHTYHIMIDTVLTDASHRSSKVCALTPPQPTPPCALAPSQATPPCTHSFLSAITIGDLCTCSYRILLPLPC